MKPAQNASPAPTGSTITARGSPERVTGISGASRSTASAPSAPSLATATAGPSERTARARSAGSSSAGRPVTTAIARTPFEETRRPIATTPPAVIPRGISGRVAAAIRRPPHLK
jgi:hypothetical protein